MLSIIAALFISTSASAASVISCSDGDTCRFRDNGGEVKVRISGIDAPEKKQTDGDRARKYLLSLIEVYDVRLDCHGRSFDRKVCHIYVPDKKIDPKSIGAAKAVLITAPGARLNVAEEMVRAGWAWDAPKYSKKKYAKLMLAAQTAKVGIWRNGTPRSPFCFRKKKHAECQRAPAHNP